MIWFRTLYLGSRLVLMDVSAEWVGWQKVYVASLSEDPRVCFRSQHPEDAVMQLSAYLRQCHAASIRVTFLPAPMPAPMAAC